MKTVFWKVLSCVLFMVVCILACFFIFSTINAGQGHSLESLHVGDTLTGTDYLIASEDTVQTYYNDGIWAITQHGIVIQVQRYLSIKQLGTPAEMAKSIGLFDISKATVTFYDKDYKQVTTIVSALSADVPYCVYEYVAWTNDEKTEGIGYSYNFTFNDVPVYMEGKVVPKTEEQGSETPSADTTTSGDVIDAESIN